MQKRLLELNTYYYRTLIVVMKPNNFAMKEWHFEHVEKTIVRFSKGLSADASSFEKRNYKKYGTLSHCMKQIEYDMKHGVDKGEVMEILRKIRLDEKYSELRENPEATGRLEELEDKLSGVQRVESLSWYNNAYREMKR
jgi:hypothetical protein